MVFCFFKKKPAIDVCFVKDGKILYQLLNNEDDKKNTIRIISGVSEVGNERYYHWAEEHVSLCNDNSLLFRWMHLLFPICQDRINLMIRYAHILTFLFVLNRNNH